MPGALIRHTSTVLPAATRADIGEAILADLRRIGGNPCEASEGAAARDRLAERLLGHGGRIVVLPEGVKRALALPGNMVVIGRPLVEDHESPEVAAGYILAARTGAEARDPIPAALRHAGLRAALGLLTTGAAPQEAFRGYGEALIAAPPADPPSDRLLERFRAAGVAASPYAYAVDTTGETTLALIEADPFAATPPPEPILDDTAWVALQGICGG